VSRRALRAVDAASVLLALAALVLALWPVGEAGEEDAALPPALTAMAGARDHRAAARMPPVDSTALSTVSGNVFSSTRRAPATRFMPPGSDESALTDADGSTGSTGADDHVLLADSGGDAASGTRDPVPALYGIVGIDGVPHALLALRAEEPPRLFAVGDRHAGYRISAIGRDRVVLATARGSRTLRLAPSAPRDTSETLP
jgi:hypothetical protein